MLLVVDIGNTNTVLGLYEGDKLTHHWRMATDDRRTSDEYTTLVRSFFNDSKVKTADIEHTIISSVVPPMSPRFEEIIQKLTRSKPTFISEIKDLIPILIDNPKEVGADRIVNSLAGYKKFNTPLIIVDFGTATTFDVVSGKGEYLGGIIAPGVNLSLEALCSHASHLPRIKVENPKTFIGKNTVQCMQAGILLGYAGMVDSLIGKISEEMGESPKVLATGGLAKPIMEVSEKIDDVTGDLTLWGLHYIYHNRVK